MSDTSAQTTNQPVQAKSQWSPPSEVTFPESVGRHVEQEGWRQYTDPVNGQEFVAYTLTMSDRPVEEYDKEYVAGNYATGIKEDQTRQQERINGRTFSQEQAPADTVADQTSDAAAIREDQHREYPMDNFALAGPVSQITDLEGRVASGKLARWVPGMPYPTLATPTNT